MAPVQKRVCKTRDRYGFTSSSNSFLKWDCGQVSSLSLNFFICKMGVIIPSGAKRNWCLVQGKHLTNGQSFQCSGKMGPDRQGSDATSSFFSCVALGTFTLPRIWVSSSNRRFIQIKHLGQCLDSGRCCVRINYLWLVLFSNSPSNSQSGHLSLPLLVPPCFWEAPGSLALFLAPGQNSLTPTFSLRSQEEECSVDPFLACVERFEADGDTAFLARLRMSRQYPFDSHTTYPVLENRPSFP